MRLNPDQIDEILAGNLRNIVRKVREKRTLTASELALLESERTGAETESRAYVTSLADLARVLGITRQYLNKLRKKPGFPDRDDAGRYAVGPCLAWFRRTTGAGAGFTNPPETNGAAEGTDLMAEILRKRKAEADKAEIEVRRLRGELIEVSTVARTLSLFAAAIRQEILSSKLSKADKNSILRTLQDLAKADFEEPIT